ncbi:hypothetical protein LIER_00057 [Lithospermum erythrorhizon]|uniref:Mitochondrial protein n=1 Tax=Lithospermum erythrorhizon TaxID=34254 RepID=A0AAV3NG65_LITER
MTSCKLSSTPLSTTPITPSASEVAPHPSDFRQIVGSLQHLLLTCSDLSFVVNNVCQHMHNPQAEHMIMVKRILRYVKSTPDLGLVLIPSVDFSGLQ